MNTLNSNEYGIIIVTLFPRTKHSECGFLSPTYWVHAMPFSNMLFCADVLLSTESFPLFFLSSLVTQKIHTIKLLRCSPTVIHNYDPGIVNVDSVRTFWCCGRLPLDNMGRYSSLSLWSSMELQDWMDSVFSTRDIGAVYAPGCAVVSTQYVDQQCFSGYQNFVATHQRYNCIWFRYRPVH